MSEQPYFLIGALLSSSVLGSVATVVLQWLASRGKNKAEAEVTLGEGWENFAQQLKQDIKDLRDENTALRKEIRDVSGAYFDQQRTISKQQERIAEQDIKISEQQEEINSLKFELEKYKQPVTLTPVTI